MSGYRLMCKSWSRDIHYECGQRLTVVSELFVCQAGCCMQEAKSTQYFYDAQVIERGSTLPDCGKRKSHAGGPPAKKPRQLLFSITLRYIA